LDTLRSRLSEEVSGIRNARRTDDFEKFATSLFKDLLLVNRMFGKSMPTPIPDMAGATNAEKIITMNKWLGLNAETQPPDTMMALSGRLVEIFNSTQQSQVAEAVSAQIKPPEKTTEAPTTVAEVIPKPVTSPIQIVTLADRLENEEITKKLDYIMQNASSRAIRSKAAFLKQKLDKSVKDPRALNNKNRSKTEKQISDATSFIKKNLSAVEAAVLARQMGAYKSIEKAREDPLASAVIELRDKLNKDEAKDPDHHIRQSLPRLFNMGQQAAANVLAMLRESSAENSEVAATKKYGDAMAIYNAEQKFFKFLLNDFILPLCAQLATDLKESKLPTYQELKSAEKEFNVGRTHLTLARKSKINRGNGKDDMVKAMEAREKYARILSQKDEVSYHEVAALFNTLVSEGRLIRALIDIYSFAGKKGVLDTAGSNERRRFLADYATASGVVADPEKDIYSEMTKQQRREVVAAYLGKSMSVVLDPNQITDKQIADAEKAIRPVLMRSLETIANDVLQRLYKSAAYLVSSDTQFGQMATLRSLSATAYVNYEKYVMGKKFEDSLDAVPLSAEELTTGRMNAARSFLSNVLDAVKAGSENDPMVKSANAWLEATKGEVPREKVAQTADMIYYMARSIAAIKEAELWQSTRVLQSSSLDPKSSDIARENIKRAREVFGLNFSGANPNPDMWVLPGYHCNEAANIANGVTNMLAPRALALTEAPATMASVASYAGPGDDMLLHDKNNPTEEERNRAAAATESRHLSMLAQLAGNPKFGIPDSEEMLRNLGLSGPMKELDFQFGRAISNAALLDFPILERLLFRRRTSVEPVDSHYVLHGTMGKFQDYFHEDTKQYHNGQLYIEELRLLLLHEDKDVPGTLTRLNKPLSEIADPQLRKDIESICKRLGVEPGNKTFLQITRQKIFDASAAYATATGEKKLDAKQLENLNGIVLAVLDARVAELRSLVRGSVDISGGSESIVALANYKDPRAAYARNAIRMLEMLQGADGKSGIRAQLAAGAKSDLTDRPINPRTAIAMAEMGIADLDPKNFEGMNKEAAPVAKGIVNIPQSAIQIDKLDQYNPVRLEFTVTRTEVTSEGGKPVSFEEFSRKNPSNLTLFWVVYQALGRTDAAGEKMQYIYNPNYVAGVSPPEERYVGIIVRGVKTDTGETGDFAVKAKWTNATSTNELQWAPIMSKDTVDMSQVLFRVKPGTVGEPQKDNLFRTRVSDAQGGKGTEFFFERDYKNSKSIQVDQYADSTPYVVGTITPIKK